MRNTQIINPKQLLTAKMTSYPSIDGHFWVVRNGEIIDTDFEWYDYCRKVNKCVDKTPSSFRGRCYYTNGNDWYV